MREKLFRGDIEKMRSPKRLELLEVERVVELSMEKLFITKVLDVGTGSGVFAEAFSLRNLNVTGIDINPEMLKVASNLVHNVKFQEASAEVMPFDDNSFDLVFLGLVLHESDEPILVLKEAKRVAERRVVILEWAYIQEEAGPPLEHRLEPEKIRKLAKMARFKDFEKIKLQHMVAYRMQP